MDKVRERDLEIKYVKIISFSYIATDNMYVIIKNGLLFILYLEVQV